MIKAVLFDFGGVLTEGGKSGAVQATIAQLCGRKPDDIKVDDLHDQFVRGAISEAEYFDEINRRYPCASPLTTEGFNAGSDIYIRCEPVYDLAAALRRAGVVTGILSNIYPISADKLRAEGFYEGFEPIILSYAEGLAKPDAKLFELALRKLGLSGEEVLFIDDQQRFEGIVKKLGMHFVWAQSPQQIVADTTALLERQNKLHIEL